MSPPPKKNPEKTSRKDIDEMQIRNLSDKESTVTVIKMLTEISGIFNKEIENLRKFQTDATDMKDIITELKNILKGFNNELDEAVE